MVYRYFPDLEKRWFILPILPILPILKPYKDGCSVVAKRYSEATTQSKPGMAANMMRRAIRSGMEADYFLGDAWFGTKPMIRGALELDLCAILRMK